MFQKTHRPECAVQELCHGWSRKGEVNDYNFHEEREKVGMMGLKKKEDDWCSVRGGYGNVFVIRAYSESTCLLVYLFLNS